MSTGVSCPLTERPALQLLGREKPAAGPPVLTPAPRLGHCSLEDARVLQPVPGPQRPDGVREGTHCRHRPCLLPPHRGGCLGHWLEAGTDPHAWVMELLSDCSPFPGHPSPGPATELWSLPGLGLSEGSPRSVELEGSGPPLPPLLLPPLLCVSLRRQPGV